MLVFILGIFLHYIQIEWRYRHPREENSFLFHRQMMMCFGKIKFFPIILGLVDYWLYYNNKIFPIPCYKNRWWLYRKKRKKKMETVVAPCYAVSLEVTQMFQSFVSELQKIYVHTQHTLWDSLKKIMPNTMSTSGRKFSIFHPSIWESLLNTNKKKSKDL